MVIACCRRAGGFLRSPLLAMALIFSISIGVWAQRNCNAPRNPALAKYQKLDVTDGWFEVYRLSANSYALWEPRSSERNFSYLIVGEKRALLFDSGFGIGQIDVVARKLTSLPVLVLNSHTHYDHVGGNHAFSTILGMDTAYTHNSEHGYPNSMMGPMIAPGSICPPLPEGVTPANYFVQPFRITDFVTDGQIIDLGGTQLEVIATPGHTPDAVCVLDRANRQLFTGDTFYPGQIWLWVPETDFDAYRKSIEKITKLIDSVDVLRPAHSLLEADPKALLKVIPAIDGIRSGTNTAFTLRGDRRVYQFDGFSIMVANK